MQGQESKERGKDILEARVWGCGRSGRNKADREAGLTPPTMMAHGRVLSQKMTGLNLLLRKDSFKGNIRSEVSQR